ncbi:MAG: hypothetical protein ACYC0F_18030 [Rhodanobacter sp.]
MAIEVKKQAAIPPGSHKGIIMDALETTTIFDPAKGPEPVVEIIIQPAWRSPDPAAETLPVNVSFPPKLNGLSALSKLLSRLDMTPQPGTQWTPNVLHGVEVEFRSTQTDKGFVKVDKDSITAAKPRR